MSFRPGDVVMDSGRCVAGEVRDVDGDVLTLVRPGGAKWTADARKCRTAAPEDREALRPSGALRLIAERPLPPPPSF
ncbi:hypothetical protein [Streptomyces sp. CC208A]|uniref:hypothetical protein n=1 Tax=Streptomyces sp. CC208A TaxID=3044573 RepID=UPI0024A8676D|nr:hypothetical protein [Streptomyces sp. CC208A]